MPVNEDLPPITPPILIPGVIGGAAAAAQEAAGDIVDGAKSFFLPPWLQKAGTYLTDKGTLIRIGVFALGAVMASVGVIAFLKTPVTGAVKSAGKLVK